MPTTTPIPTSILPSMPTSHIIRLRKALMKILRKHPHPHYRPYEIVRKGRRHRRSVSNGRSTPTPRSRKISIAFDPGRESLEKRPQFIWRQPCCPSSPGYWRQQPHHGQGYFPVSRTRRPFPLRCVVHQEYGERQTRLGRSHRTVRVRPTRPRTTNHRCPLATTAPRRKAPGL